MNQIIAAVFGGLAVMAVSTAYGQEPSTLSPGKGYMFGIGPAEDGPAPRKPQPTPLFTFGGLNVGVWAPMEPHYNAGANRDPAGESFWSTD
jgi:hypothetical protein